MITKGYLPLITKPTRITTHSATLIDHIYSNTTPQNYTPGIIISNLADHFGTFYTSTKSTPADLPKYKSVRVMKQANITYFAELLSSTDFGSVFSHECPNDAYNTHLFDVAFPIKIIRLAGRYIKREDWVTQGIINSSITESQLLRKKTHNPSVQNITKFKKYCKLFTKIKRSAKAKYYTEIFEYNVNDMKRTWQILRSHK